MTVNSPARHSGRLAAGTRRPPTHGAGYTLLEAALAISISMVLVYAMYSTMAMHYQTVETGREIAEQSQLARAVLDRIRTDLRATFTSWQPYVAQSAATGGTSGSASGASTSTGSSASGSTGSSGSGQSSGVQSDYNPPPGGILGTDATLTAAVYNSTEDLDFNAAGGQTNPGASLSDVRMVRYWLATDRNPAPNGKAGLVRERIHRIPDPTLSSGSVYSTTDVLAEEVQSIQFRYYDGSEWLTYWDSTQTAAPLAVEAQVQMLLPSTAEGVNAGSWVGNVETPSGVDAGSPQPNGGKSLVTFKVVVAMPPTAATAAAAPASGGS